MPNQGYNAKRGEPKQVKEAVGIESNVYVVVLTSRGDARTLRGETRAKSKIIRGSGMGVLKKKRMFCRGIGKALGVFCVCVCVCVCVFMIASPYYFAFGPSFATQCPSITAARKDNNVHIRFDSKFVV